MAAGSLYSHLESPFALKRKRHNEDDDDVFRDAFTTKRRNFSQLPIRSPPLSRPTISVTPAFAQYAVSPGILTPDSIPEDEEYESSHLWSQQPTSSNRIQVDSQNFNGSEIEQLGHEAFQRNETTENDGMDIASPKPAQLPTPGRIGRARSNDLMSPVRLPANPRSLLGPLSPTYRNSFAQERVATPVALSFPSRSPFESSFASATARQMRNHLQTTLSPMVNADSWTPQIHHPPSPEPDVDSTFPEDTAMEDSHMMSSSFGALSVQGQDDHETYSLDSSPLRVRSSQTSASSMTSFSRQGLGLNDNHRTNEGFSQTHTSYDNVDEQRSNHQHNRNTSSGGRTARLHMGYKADCEKCVARVPGHYSHIIWS